MLLLNISKKQLDHGSEFHNLLVLMGLLFPLQPDTRKSVLNKLVLKTTKRRFAMGTGFLFGAALIGTMYLAASPLFKVFWSEGNFFDKSLASFFYFSIFLYPLFALICWFFEESVVILKESHGGFSVNAFDKLFFLKWNTRGGKITSLDEIHIRNWMGAKNVAALSAEEKGQKDRYATKGHWILYGSTASTSEPIHIERRAKLDDVEYLRAQILDYFASAPAAATPTFQSS